MSDNNHMVWCIANDFHGSQPCNCGAASSSSFVPARGSAAWWVRVPWDIEEPMCVKCGHTMGLRDGCEWDDDPDMNLCHDCALDVIREMWQKLVTI